ncbi:Crp/Fnr family transcriptional regulator [Anabaena subtropica]|uniref:Crp/Fnr family transcriptional regulator n=1 Tax=Anabaena subtropica FACHB-260 TaxID=2692884 RepID=A0ABR8CU90_9NOST|nr:Crp/Fnr family transcriptional regulator [Anabaena subtropica]MBD2346108.1 Crp/Fnr family transcriptional regulator [Anabaena subtropica FACHB-260]
MLTSAYLQLSHVLQTLAEIPADEIQKLTRTFYPLTLIAGNFFIQAGDIPCQIGFVVSGLLRLYYVNPTGTDLTKSFCPENHFVAAYSALILKSTAQFSIEALEDSLLLVADYSQFTQLCAEHPCWQTINHKFVEALFIKKEKREAELLIDDATTRYQKFLAEYPNLDKRIKQYHIASYLGISPVSLSRIRKNFQPD